MYKVYLTRVIFQLQSPKLSERVLFIGDHQWQMYWVVS